MSRYAVIHALHDPGRVAFVLCEATDMHSRRDKVSGLYERIMRAPSRPNCLKPMKLMSINNLDIPVQLAQLG